MVLNARSIAKEDAFPAFRAELTDNNCNISLVCETWLKENLATHLICPPGFTVLRNDREERRGGGVAIFCRCDWKLKFWMNLRMTLSVCGQEYQLLIQFFLYVLHLPSTGTSLSRGGLVGVSWRYM